MSSRANSSCTVFLSSRFLTEVASVPFSSKSRLSWHFIIDVNISTMAGIFLWLSEVGCSEYSSLIYLSRRQRYC